MGQKHAETLRAVPSALPSKSLGSSLNASESDEWVAFPGGELEGRPPRALCAACRDKLARAAASRLKASKPAGRTICFQCYRADLDRQQAMRAAGELDTASDARFQDQLPFEPVNRPRLQMLKTERAGARTVTPMHVDKRRRAQIEARHALQRIAAGLNARVKGHTLAAIDRDRALFQAVHAAELQLPESWLPFVIRR